MVFWLPRLASERVEEEIAGEGGVVGGARVGHRALLLLRNRNLRDGHNHNSLRAVAREGGHLRDATLGGGRELLGGTSTSWRCCCAP